MSGPDGEEVYFLVTGKTAHVLGHRDQAHIEGIVKPVLLAPGLE
jgi:hypothetical protein